MTPARDAKKKTVDPLERRRPEEHQPNEAGREHSLLHLQRLAGNQAVVRLLESRGQLRTKLRTSEPGDEHEQEADRVAAQVLSLAPAPSGVVQRKCADCSPGAKCAACAEEEKTIQRKAKSASVLSSTVPHIQRATRNGNSASPDAATELEPEASPARTLIVEDEATNLAPGQMRKSEFLGQLRRSVSAAADQALSSAGQSGDAGSYIEPWLDQLATRDATQVEQSLRNYAPETETAGSARDYITAVSTRISRAVDTWARTGEITGVPPEMAGLLSGGGLGAVAGIIGGALSGIVSGIGSAVSAAAGAVGSAVSSVGRALFKRKEGAIDDPREIQAELSGGQSLDAGAGSRLGAAFGHDFSHVRVHTDAHAAGLSDSLNARAFTIGSDIAFGAGEYQPGTLIGDALIAHELAHVVQQGGGAATVGPKDHEPQSAALEDEADESAVQAVAAAWGRKIEALRDLGHNAMPRLKSGLKLQRCGGNVRHQGAVAGAQPGQVEARTGESCTGLDNPIALSYTGPDRAQSHWVQFYWSHVAVPTAGGAPATLQCPSGQQHCGFRTHLGGPSYLTTDLTNKIWMVDVSLRDPDPYYPPSDVTLTDPQSAQAVLMRDRPGIDSGRELGSRVVGQFPNAQSAQYIQSFETYLIRNNAAAYCISWMTVTTLTRSGNSMDISGREYQNITGTPVSALPTDLRTIMLQFYSTYQNIH